MKIVGSGKDVKFYDLNLDWATDVLQWKLQSETIAQAGVKH